MKIVISKERLTKSLKIGEWLDLQAGNVATIVNVMARFAVDDNGNPIPHDQAISQIKEMTIEELNAAALGLNNAITDAAVNPPSAPI